MAKQTINSGTAPIVWSTVDEAFQAINDNFTELYLTVSGGPGAVVDLTDLGSSLIPRSTEFYDLGSNSKRWKDLYLSGSSLYLGDAVITSTGTGINLPFGSTIGGTTLDQEYFKEIAVAGQSNIVADPGGSDTLTIVAGNAAITLTTDASTDTLTITNSGVTSLTTNTGLSTNVTATGAVTVTNTGVIGFDNGTTLPDARAAGAGITVSATSGDNIFITNTGVLEVNTFGGSGITITNPSPGVYQFSNAAPNINQNVFRDVAVSGQSTLVADSAADTLTFANGTGIDITTNEPTDTITITNTGVTALAASGVGITVSSSSGSVNISNTGVTSLVAGSGISISSATGAVTINNTRHGFQNFAVSGDPNPIQADNTSDTFTFVPGEGVVLIPNPGNDSLEVNVSYLVGNVYGEDSSVLVNAALGQIVGPINSFDGFNSISMTVGGVIIGGTAGASIIGAAGAPIYLGGGASGTTSGDIYIGNGTNKTLFVSNTIDTDDSSALLFDPVVNFKTNVIIDGDLQLNGDNNIYGSGTAGNHGYGIINLIPDATLETSNQYIVIDPTGPNHIHIRAGGVSDESNIDLRLGGENTYVSVYDGTAVGDGTVGISVKNIATGIPAQYNFSSDGGFLMPQLSAAPALPYTGAIYLADGATWDPAAKGGSPPPYHVAWDGVSWNALY